MKWQLLPVILAYHDIVKLNTKVNPKTYNFQQMLLGFDFK